MSETNQTQNQFTNERLKEMQSWDLDRKIATTLTRIAEFANHFNNQVYVSFSGGKDSTVLLDLVRKIIPDVPVVFSNTGLEYPEIQAFARSKGAEFVRPKMMFNEVITKYGYPIISKEVSEAIYYARRIVKVSAERERERERELSCSQLNVNGRFTENNKSTERTQRNAIREVPPSQRSPQKTRRSSWKETNKKRKELCGQRTDKDEYG